MIITTVTTDGGAILPLGRQGEKGVRQVWFDLGYLIENFGEGTAVLVHQRNQDLAPYIVNAEQSGNNLMWTLDELDTAYEGFGKAEIRWTVDGTLAKTVIYKTSVLKSLTGDAVIPDPYESWYDQMIEYIDERSISPDQIDEAVAEYLDEHPVVAPVNSVNGQTGSVVLDAEDVGALPDSTVIPSRTSDLQNDSGFITGYTETDPTVPAWAKAANKPTYTAQEVGALPSSTVIPTKTSDLQNDSGFVNVSGAAAASPVQKVNNKIGNVVLTASDVGAGTYSKPTGGIPKTDLASAVQTSLGKADTALQSFTETDPTVPTWAKAQSKPSYTAQEVGAIASPSSPATGAFLVWNGSAWVAQTLSTWQGGAY